MIIHRMRMEEDVTMQKISKKKKVNNDSESDFKNVVKRKWNFLDSHLKKLFFFLRFQIKIHSFISNHSVCYSCLSVCVWPARHYACVPEIVSQNDNKLSVTNNSVKWYDYRLFNICRYMSYMSMLVWLRFCEKKK